VTYEEVTEGNVWPKCTPVDGCVAQIGGLEDLDEIPEFENVLRLAFPGKYKLGDVVNVVPLAVVGIEERSDIRERTYQAL
jgi:hypothetical protein